MRNFPPIAAFFKVLRWESELPVLIALHRLLPLTFYGTIAARSTVRSIAQAKASFNWSSENFELTISANGNRSRRDGGAT